MSKKFTASYEPYKILLPVLLPFARDATSAYKLNTSYVLHVFTKTDTIDESNDPSHRTVKLCDRLSTSKPRSGNEFVCEYMP